MNIKRIIFWWIAIVLFLWWFVITNTFAQSTNPLCSTSLRWASPSHTPQSLYQPDQFKISYMIATNAINNISELSQSSIVWNIAWHNNFSNCNPDSPTSAEKSLRESRRSLYKTLPSVNVSVVNDNVSLNDAKILQWFINSACALWLNPDSKIGIKTLNAVKYCKPPALWYLTWSQFLSMYLKLYSDPQWTQFIYKNGEFQSWNPSEKLHFRQSDFPSQQPSPGLWLVIDNSVTNGTSAVAWISNVAGSAPICRFQPPNDSIPQEYTTAVGNVNEYKVPTDCSKWCDGWYTEVKKGWISICEKCDIEKCNCGIKLNTNIPFIGRCIMNQQTNNVGQSANVTTVNTLNAFPILMGALIKLLMSIIMIVCFASLIVWGFMMTVPDQYDTGKWIVKKVIRTIVALWSLGTILYLINPNFFS
jgi:hypothetical protein